ncbi:hypothetical protein HCN51_36965 [Nonomuraea sp. FMUSA5-5]|uniref:HEAT repeat domain-containing protein n=1 Tax=Nonomuraea composti TaxID=2720023 RepID=A0ABX1BB00_9ACTN|nr:hypothetical protein [Nonomuraea sp. FMUSA5-5]NJP94965.1 hypothetical protein [Nonomuraea sp. FMUSA5-5]
MDRITSAIPEAGPADTAALREIDPDELARYVLDPRNPWWRRRRCAEALFRRVPEARVPELLERIRDPRESTDVRLALLAVLGHREELLPWLLHDDQRNNTSFRWRGAILKARGEAGDLTAAAELSTLAFDQWHRNKAKGRAGLDALVERHGVAAVDRLLGDRPEDRAFRVLMRHRAGEDITPALADPDVGVAYEAYSLTWDDEALRAFARDAPTVEGALWAALGLYDVTDDLDEIRAIDEALGRPRVEVQGLDAEIRAAIVHRYVPECEVRTDPRWRMEALITEPPPPTDVEGQLRRASDALARAGQSPEPPVHCGEDYGQGTGTYHVIRCAGGTVLVSMLGRFVTGSDEATQVRAPLEAAGFRWIDDDLGAITVDGLCVYWFGTRDPINVRALLFYWQD